MRNQTGLSHKNEQPTGVGATKKFATKQKKSRGSGNECVMACLGVSGVNCFLNRLMAKYRILIRYFAIKRSEINTTLHGSTYPRKDTSFYPSKKVLTTQNTIGYIQAQCCHLGDPAALLRRSVCSKFKSTVNCRKVFLNSIII